MTQTYSRSGVAERPSLSSNFRPDVQGLRALAVLMVIVHHAGLPLSGGFIGVDVFFVISGYVITSLIVREVVNEHRFRFGRFYRRRVLRLLPALAVMTSIVAVVSMLIVSPLGVQQQTASAGGAATLWSSNFALYAIASDYFSDQVQLNPFLHTWSLGVEEQFYVGFPLVIFLCFSVGRRFGRPRLGLMFGVGVFAVASFALSLGTSFGMISAIQDPSNFAFYASPIRAWEFAVGALVAIVPVPRILNRAGASVSVALAGVCLIVVGAVRISEADPFPGVVALWPVLGCALVIWAGGPHNRVSTWFSTALMVKLGDISYSLYLWHWPLIVFARRLFLGSELAVGVAVACSFVISFWSYRYVETVFRESRGVSRNVKGVLLVAVIVPGTLNAVLLAGSLASWGNPVLRTNAAQLLARPMHEGSCQVATPVSQRNLMRCTWGQQRTGRPIYLLGDSNASMYTEAVVRAGAIEGRPVVVAAWPGCALVDVQYIVRGQPLKQQECNRYVRDALSWLAKQKPGTVLMGSSNASTTQDFVTLASSRSATAVNSAIQKSLVWERGIESVVRQLKQAGHQPVLIHLAPHFPDPRRQWWHPSDCPNYVLFSRPENCGRSLPLSSVERDQRLAYDSEMLASMNTGIQTIDLRPVLCPGGVCATFRRGAWVYRDGSHISPLESARLGPFFARQLALGEGSFGGRAHVPPRTGGTGVFP